MNIFGRLLEHTNTFTGDLEKYKSLKLCEQRNNSRDFTTLQPLTFAKSRIITQAGRLEMDTSHSVTSTRKKSLRLRGKCSLFLCGITKTEMRRKV
jgi:hypothetical protein